MNAIIFINNFKNNFYIFFTFDWNTKILHAIDWNKQKMLKFGQISPKVTKILQIDLFYKVEIIVPHLTSNFNSKTSDLLLSLSFVFDLCSYEPTVEFLLWGFSVK